MDFENLLLLWGFSMWLLMIFTGVVEGAISENTRTLKRIHRIDHYARNINSAQGCSICNEEKQQCP